MIIVLEYSFWNLALAFLAEKLQKNVLEVLQTRQLGIKRIVPESWQELALTVSASEDIFGEANEFFLVDCHKLSLLEPTVEFWKSISAAGTIFLYRSTDSILLAADRKNLKTAKAEFYTFKAIDTEFARFLAKERNKLLSTPISTKVIDFIVNKASHYDEIIDAIDYLSLTNDAEKHMNDLFVQEAVQPFMMPFRPFTHPHDLHYWATIPENDIQFALAIISSKLLKNRSERNDRLLKELVATDFNLKDSAKLSGLTWWKLFLWKSKNVA